MSTSNINSASHRSSSKASVKTETATKKTSSKIPEAKIVNKSDEEFQDGYFQLKESVQKIDFAKVQQLIQRNVTKNVSKTYTQYTKDTVKTYLQNPGTSLSYIIEISRFLERNSTLYRKMLTYYAAAPLYYYNLIQENDLSKAINSKKSLKDYLSVAKKIQGFNLKKEFFGAMYDTVRDGMYVGFEYDDEEHYFFMPLDIKYCRIYGKNAAGQWIVYFDATYFNQGNNKIFVEGVDGDTAGCWDQVFIDGWNGYQDDTDARWFELPAERAFCMIAGTDSDFDVPLPLFVGLFIYLMDLEDLGNILNAKNELEVYKLLVSKIPLLNSNDPDDFAISLTLAEMFNDMLDNVAPELVGNVVSPMDLEVVNFENSNSTKDTDKLAESIKNVFNNAGMSQLVVAGGESTNSIGLKYSIANDASNIWVYVNRIESWLNYFIKMNISDGYILKIHEMTWYNREEYQNQKRDMANVGGSAMDFLTTTQTPYEALLSLNWENALGIKDLLQPLKTSYTMTGDETNNTGGAPTKDEGDLTDEGAASRLGDKNDGTKANG